MRYLSILYLTEYRHPPRRLNRWKKSQFIIIFLEQCWFIRPKKQCYSSKIVKKTAQKCSIFIFKLLNYEVILNDLRYSRSLIIGTMITVTLAIPGIGIDKKFKVPWLLGFFTNNSSQYHNPDNQWLGSFLLPRTFPGPSHPHNQGLAVYM